MMKIKTLKAVFGQFFKNHFRDKFSVFWSLLFPLVLMTILILVFGGMEEGEMNFKVSLVNLAEGGPVIPGSEESVADIIEEVLVGAADGNDGNWLDIYLPETGESADDFLAHEKELVERGERHTLLVIPRDFNQQVMDKIGYKFMSVGSEPDPAVLSLYRNPGNQMSRIGADIAAGIISGINRETNINSGLVSEAELSKISINNIETAVEAEEGEGFSMVDYLLPGIILMTFLSSGMEMFVEKLSSQRERGILRRYFATPLRPFSYFTGLLAFIVFMSIVQLFLIYGFGRLVFGFDINLFTLPALGYMVYSLVVFQTLGFLLLSLSRSSESAGAITQAVIYPLMFLGGLFFPVMGLPGFLRIVVLVNPVTYLINGLRDALGVYPSPTSFYSNLLIPALWSVAGILLAIKKFNWNPEGEK